MKSKKLSISEQLKFAEERLERQEAHFKSELLKKELEKYKAIAHELRNINTLNSAHLWKYAPLMDNLIFDTRSNPHAETENYE